jgi:hypothetical protein
MTSSALARSVAGIIFYDLVNPREERRRHIDPEGLRRL